MSPIVPLLILVAFCTLGLLALRYGYDSTQTELVSDEERLARGGVTWDDRASTPSGSLAPRAPSGPREGRIIPFPGPGARSTGRGSAA